MVWEKKGISVYKKKSQPIPVYTLKNAGSIGPKTDTLYHDFIFMDFGDYVTSKNPQDLYPLRNIADNQNRLLSFAETQKGLSYKLNSESESYILPSINGLEKTLTAELLIERSSDLIILKVYPKSPEGIRRNGPITIETFMPEGKGILSINKTFNFSLDESIPESTPFSLGNVFLNLSEDNFIYFYPYEDEVNLNFNPFYTNYILENCGLSEQKPNFGINETENGFTLFGDNSQICLYIPLAEVLSYSEIPSEEFLLTLNYVNEGLRQDFCIMKRSEGRCIYNFSKQLGSRNTTNYKSIGVSASELSDLYMRIFLDTTEGSSEKKITYSDFVFGLSSPLSTSLLDGEELSHLFDQSKEKISDITFSFSGIDSLSRPITSLPKTGGPCSIISHKEVLLLRKSVIKEEKEDYIRYSSSEGSFCDHFSYSELSHEQGYIIAITSRNVEGLPLRLCVTNTVTKRCDLYTHLHSENSFEKEFFLLPPSGVGSGYDININNFAIKNSATINDLKSIEVLSFPYEWATKIHTNGEIIAKSFRIIPQVVTRYNSSLYSASGSFESSDVLVLSQAYDDGWKLFKTNSINALSEGLPFIFGKEIGEHVLVNNWSNGWVLGENINGNFIIGYWPQYLEYLGLILSFGAIAFLLLKTVKSRRKV